MARVSKRNDDMADELAREADAVLSKEKARRGGGGTSISTKGGVLTVGGKEVKGNVLTCVVVDYAFENTYYAEKYDQANPLPPTCYALGRDEDVLEPSEKSEEAQSEDCASCPMNEFGSAETGRGKACKNSRRLVVWVPDEEDEESEPSLGVLKVPVTSVKNFTEFARSVAEDLRKPYWAVVVSISTKPNRNSQYEVTFTVEDALDKDMLKMVKDLRENKTEEIAFQEYPTKEEMMERSSRRQEEESRSKSKLKKRTPGKKATRARKF